MMDNEPNNCPFGCNIPYSNISTMRCHYKVETVTRGTQTGTLFDDFQTQEIESQFLDHLLNYNRHTEAVDTFCSVDQNQQLAGQRLEKNGEHLVDFDSLVIENGEQKDLAGIRQQQAWPEVDSQQSQQEAISQNPQQTLMQEQLQRDLDKIQLMLDLAKRRRVQKKVEEQRLNFDLVVSEQPPLELFEPEQQLEII